jgi:hypothetical protein
MGHCQTIFFDTNFYFLTDIEHETHCPLVPQSFSVENIMKETCLLAIHKGEFFFLGSDSEVSMQSRDTTLREEMFATKLISVHRLGSLLDLLLSLMVVVHMTHQSSNKYAISH